MSVRTEIEIQSMTKLQNYMCGYKDSKFDVLRKLRDEISWLKLGYPPSADYYRAIVNVLEIIDKYRNDGE